MERNRRDVGERLAWLSFDNAIAHFSYYPREEAKRVIRAMAGEIAATFNHEDVVAAFSDAIRHIDE